MYGILPNGSADSALSCSPPGAIHLHLLRLLLVPT